MPAPASPVTLDPLMPTDHTDPSVTQTLWVTDPPTTQITTLATDSPGHTNPPTITLSSLLTLGPSSHTDPLGYMDPPWVTQGPRRRPHSGPLLHSTAQCLGPPAPP